MQIVGRTLILTTALAGASLALGGCATEDYVDKHIALVNQRIDGVEAHLAQVEGTANQANQTAQAAMGSAQQANQRLDQLTSRVDAIEQKLASRKPHG
ncbi:MAG TPA: Lpp/OprI family alanine-zipper lipoprotein [Sphingomicrobium sp.]|jgi:outer membrane murein-binding lipoprotein Lpp|nr:Lpp/OprI family alanine-zipper lipoprotein [Sphingomicrobium sp.]